MIFFYITQLKNYVKMIFIFNYRRLVPSALLVPVYKQAIQMGNTALQAGADLGEILERHLGRGRRQLQGPILLGQGGDDLGQFGQRHVTNGGILSHLPPLPEQALAVEECLTHPCHFSRMRGHRYT